MPSLCGHDADPMRTGCGRARHGGRGAFTFPALVDDFELIADGYGEDIGAHFPVAVSILVDGGQGWNVAQIEGNGALEFVRDTNGQTEVETLVEVAHTLVALRGAHSEAQLQTKLHSQAFEDIVIDHQGHVDEVVRGV